MDARAAGDGERALQDFHARHPGASERVFGGGRLADGDDTSYDRLVARLREAGPGDGPVLDLACGDGAVLRRMEAAGVRAVGCDLSGAELAAAGPTLRTTPLVRARAQRLPFADGSLGGLSCHMALMLLDDLDVVVDELARVLSPGAPLAVVVGRRAAESGVISSAMTALTAALREHGGMPAVGDSRTRNAEGLAELFAAPRWSGLCCEDLELVSHVPLAELPAWLRLAYYPVEDLAARGLDAMDRWARDEAPTMAGDGGVRWMHALRLVTLRRGR